MITSNCDEETREAAIKAAHQAIVGSDNVFTLEATILRNEAKMVSLQAQNDRLMDHILARAS